MCLFMPTGVLTLLQAAIAFCQERELKGHSPDMRASSSSRPGLFPSLSHRSHSLQVGSRI